jgi:hypothetical protein
MTTGQSRRFTLFDAGVFIAATAAVAGSIRFQCGDLPAVIATIEPGRLLETAYLRHVIGATPHSGRSDSMLAVLAGYFGAAMYGRLLAGWWSSDSTSWGWRDESVPALPVRSTGQAAAIAEDVYLAILPFLVFWSCALLALRLVRPRPAASALASQPGASASAVATATVLALPWTESVLARPCSPVLISIAVGLAWLILRLGGRWQAEQSWIDRAGRALGCAWIALIPVYLVWRLPWWQA